MLALLDVLDPEHLIGTLGLLGVVAIVFAESGLLVGFFLPGDSLLFTAGAVAGGAFSSALPDVHFPIAPLVAAVVIAAVAGDQVGYVFGRKVGPRLYGRPDSRFFRHEHLVEATRFFERHGPRAIILARFVPIARTFTPVVAGASRMEYPMFVRVNVIGGVAWGAGITLLGYWFGQVQLVRDHLELAILGVVALSLVPAVVEVIRHRRARPVGGVDTALAPAPLDDA